MRSPALGDFTVRARAEEDTSTVGAVDTVIVAVKAYDNATALPLIRPMLGPATSVLSLQNGVDSANEVAAHVGEAAVLGGTTYIATALAAPGVIVQTGTHRRIVFGEVCGTLPRTSERVRALRDALAGADIQVEAVGDGRVHLPRAARRLYRRGAPPDRAALGGHGDPGAVSGWMPRGRAPRASRRRADRGRYDRSDPYLYCGHTRDDAVVAADRFVPGQAHRGGGAPGSCRAPRAEACSARADHLDIACGAEAVGTPTRLTRAWNRASSWSGRRQGSTAMKTVPPAFMSTICSRRSSASEYSPSFV